MLPHLYAAGHAVIAPAHEHFPLLQTSGAGHSPHENFTPQTSMSPHAPPRPPHPGARQSPASDVIGGGGGAASGTSAGSSPNVLQASAKSTIVLAMHAPTGDTLRGIVGS